jgi:hypothetical protein
VRGWNICRFHGARGGAPKGKANGAWKQGLFSEGAKTERLLVRLLLKDAANLRKLLSDFQTGESKTYGGFSQARPLPGFSFCVFGV